MEQSKVYFTTFKTTGSENLLQKLHRLMKQTGFENIDFKEKYAAIKIHFGEYGNLAFLRPNYARVVADYVKELGGKPFLTDCNTLYVGSRKNALDHLDTAYVNGFSPLQTGCHVIIGDGLKGTDEAIVPINGEYVKEAKIGQAIMDADVFISLTHFKGHEMAGFGGAIKNIGMGCGSRAGKMEQHCDGKPSVDCEDCVGCGRCLAVCPKDAISADFSDSIAMLNYKMAEYTLAVCKDRPCFHISLICDVSPNCDCHSENDIPIISNVGMLASFDPVALDQACADLCNKMPVNNGSVLYDNITNNHKEDCQCHEKHEDHFHMTHPDTEWESCLAHAEKIGIGTRQYELITI